DQAAPVTRPQEHGEARAGADRPQLRVVRARGLEPGHPGRGQELVHVALDYPWRLLLSAATARSRAASSDAGASPPWPSSLASQGHICLRLSERELATTAMTTMIPRAISCSGAPRL